MRLTRLEQRALWVINDAYPIPHESDSHADYTVDERPFLLTAEGVHGKCTATLNEVRDAITKLSQFQLVAFVYLVGPGEYADHVMMPGHAIRLRPLPMSADQAPTGRHTFQITQRGKDIVATFIGERLKCAWWKFFEDRLLVTLAILITVAGTALLTWLGVHK